MPDHGGIPLNVAGQRNAATFVVMVLALPVWASGCATKEVALHPGGPGGDASPPEDVAPKDVSGEDVARKDVGTSDTRPEAPFPIPFCLSYVEPIGDTCSVCYDQWGIETSRSCLPPKISCVLRDELSGVRCLYCDENPTVSKACLKCETPIAGCSQCLWSDNPGEPCKRCVDAAGVVSSDSCDALRKELR